MKIFFLRLLFILVVVFFEFSFFDVLLPSVSAPLIVLVSVVAWALILSFPRVLLMTIPLTVFFDVVSSGTPGTLALYAVLLVYATSFLSRRLLLEHRGTGMALYALFASFGTLGFAIFEFLFSRAESDSFFWTRETLALFFSLVPSKNLFLSMLLCIPLFIFSYFIIKRFEEYMSSIAQREVLEVR